MDCKNAIDKLAKRIITCLINLLDAAEGFREETNNGKEEKFEALIQAIINFPPFLLLFR